MEIQNQVSVPAVVGALAFSGAYFGQGTSTKQYGNFLCSNESGLLQCPHSSVTCSHAKNAGVRCRGKLSAVIHELLSKLICRQY